MDPHKKSPDPSPTNQTWVLSGCVATMFLLRVMAKARLEACQSKLLGEVVALRDKQRFKASLLEHKRAE